MTYKPKGARSFGPPLVDRLPAFAYLTLVTAVVGVILYGHTAPSTSRIFEYIVVGDQHRIISSTNCAIMLGISGVAAVIRTHLRGVVIHPDGIEMRELLMGWPKMRRYDWSQIDRVVVPNANSTITSQRSASRRSIGLNLWDGTTTYLPDVANLVALSVIIERVALARAIPVVGGTGLIDDLGNPLEEG